MRAIPYLMDGADHPPRHATPPAVYAPPISRSRERRFNVYALGAGAALILFTGVGVALSTAYTYTQNRERLKKESQPEVVAQAVMTAPAGAVPAPPATAAPGGTTVAALPPGATMSAPPAASETAPPREVAAVPAVVAPPAVSAALPHVAAGPAAANQIPIRRAEPVVRRGAEPSNVATPQIVERSARPNTAATPPPAVRRPMVVEFSRPAAPTTRPGSEVATDRGRPARVETGRDRATASVPRNQTGREYAAVRGTVLGRTVSRNEWTPSVAGNLSPVAVAPGSPGVSERRIVERLPDGRTRTTVIRQVSRSQRASVPVEQAPSYRRRPPVDDD